MPLILDVETIPLAASLDAPYPKADRSYPSNYKSEEAIAKWYERDEAAWKEERVKECSLNPRLGRIVCLGYARAHQPEAILAPTEADEASLLADFWLLARDARGEVVTWNGTFDLRFLVVRSLALGITPTLESSTIRAWFRKYATYPHFDCKALLTNWEPYKAGEGLNEWSAFLGCAGKTEGISGKDVYPMYQLGHFDEIVNYCKDDVASTLAVYHRIAPVFGEAA